MKQDQQDHMEPKDFFGYDKSEGQCFSLVVDCAIGGMLIPFQVHISLPPERQHDTDAANFTPRRDRGVVREN